MAEHVRTVKTSSGATAVQIVRYEKRKRIVVSHIGSARSIEDLFTLKREALRKIEATALQKRLFPEEETEQSSPILVRNKIAYLGARHALIYEALTEIFGLFNFPKLHNQLLLDLVLMRIIQPVSKLESLMYLSEMFGIHYKAGSLYQALQLFPKLKTTTEEKIVAFAKEHYSFDFSMVFYDVTTLYYESFTEDEDTTDAEGNVIEKGLRKDGLGKEIKIGQPIIVIGLMVTKEGFPVSFEVYEGNTFEGDTFIPSILSFKKKYNIQTFTIVADAAMISFENIEKLKEQKLSYIVGARITNLKQTEMKQIHTELIGKNQTAEELKMIDGKSIRIQTERGLLICDFSLKRYQKDKREMEKQILKAEYLVSKNTDGKRTKFLMLKQDNQTTGKKRKKKGEKKEKAYALNMKLIEKTKRLLGIKGYYTNLFEKDEELTDQDIITHYHSLWHVEKAFRIAKSDLAMRPIYHFKRQTIEAHILICFMALAICKYMELKSGKSTKKIVRLLMSITDARIRNKLTGEII
ncbi:IS1634 family transposase, partial [Patescibacteria group bacterium]|nr:IS1634 family transposase [Patescibacteria group bacterium]